MPDYLMLNQYELPEDNGARQWEGEQFQDTNASLILIDLPPGGGPRLHRHPYQEIFVVHQGRALYTIGQSTVEARSGQILVVPEGVAHKFVNSGPGRLMQTDIHLNKRFETEWLEEV